MTEDEFVALWGNGSAVKEWQAINLKKGGTRGKGQNEGEEREGRTKEGVYIIYKS